MAEVLSQSQIDALLASVASGDTDNNSSFESKEKGYRNYDFHSPKKFTKDKLNMLRNIHNNYSKIVVSRINSLLRVNSEVSVLSVEEVRCHEFSNVLSDNDALTVIHVKPENGRFDSSQIYMHISIPLMLNMIDRMSGGVEDTPIDVSSSYAYTDIELQLYENIVKYFVTVMKDSWHDYSNLDFSIGKLETAQGLFQQIGMDEIVIIIVLEVKINDVTEKINICLPATMLFDIFAEIEERNAPQPKITGNEDETAKEIFSTIKEASLEISAKIGGATVYLKDICDLEIGDVINMNRPKNTDIDVLIEDNLWFRGKMGIKDKNIAVKINDVCNK